MLPFETLLLPVPLPIKQTIATAASNVVVSSAATIPLHEKTCPSSSVLRIGFISHDFNNHPTAHLVEALFALRNAQVELYAYNYGVNDGSVYYDNIKMVIHIVLASLSYDL